MDLKNTNEVVKRNITSLSRHVTSRHVTTPARVAIWLSIFPKTMELDGLTMLEHAPNRETNPLMLFRAISG